LRPEELGWVDPFVHLLLNILRCRINKSSILESYSVKIKALCFLHQVLCMERGVSLLAVVVVMSLSFSLSPSREESLCL
jgi:hypothetical protein